MRPRSLPIDIVSALLTAGEARDTGLGDWIPGEAFGLWCTSANASRLVGSPVLARLASESLNEREAQAAVFGCIPEFRSAWIAIVAARLKEYGSGRNVRELISAISKLAPASRAIREKLAHLRQKNGVGRLRHLKS